MANNPCADKDSMAKIHRRERFADFAHTLARVEWQFFTTHTFKNPLPKPYVRGSMFWRWCRDVSNFSGVPYKNLLIALRGEEGERGGRPHFHALICGLTTCNMFSIQSQMLRSWKIISGNAKGDFRVYDRSLAGADYICKCLGANSYEINKFSIAEETTLSDSVISLIRVLDAKGDRRCRELTCQNGQVVKITGLKPADSLLDGVKAGLPLTSNICDKTASIGAGMGQAALAGVATSPSVDAGRSYVNTSDGIIKL